MAARGSPAHPAAWLTSIVRRAIDLLRRDATLMRKQATLQTLADLEASSPAPTLPSDGDDGNARWDDLPDERLKLFFTCCHPALLLEARIALTLHTLGGLATEEIARAFLVSEATMAQRLTRADLLRRAGDAPAAETAYQYALACCKDQVERRFLLRRLRELRHSS